MAGEIRRASTGDRIQAPRRLATTTLSLLVVGALVSHRTARAADVLPLPAEDRKEITILLGPGVVGDALPSKPIDDPSVYFPLREKSYQVTGGKNTGKTQTLQVAQGAPATY